MKHIVKCAVGGKNGGIHLRINLSYKLLKVFTARDGRIGVNESCNIARSRGTRWSDNTYHLGSRDSNNTTKTALSQVALCPKADDATVVATEAAFLDASPYSQRAMRMRKPFLDCGELFRHLSRAASPLGSDPIINFPHHSLVFTQKLETL